jgi:hypothetical protein
VDGSFGEGELRLDCADQKPLHWSQPYAGDDF